MKSIFSFLLCFSVQYFIAISRFETEYCSNLISSSFLIIFKSNYSIILFYHLKYALWTDWMAKVSLTIHFIVAANRVAIFGVKFNSSGIENCSSMVWSYSFWMMIQIYRFHFLTQILCLLKSLNSHLHFLYLITNF